ncbi:MAG: TrkH family potassium uptake protein [Chlorobi bacterium]|nr:TrkH family potassium uptake protein [Chlorobiota bacterium]
MIHFKVIFKIIGFLLILEGLFMLLGIPFSIYYQSDDLFVLLFSAISVAAIGLILFLLAKGDDKELRKKEGYIVVGLGWVVLSLFGAIPFVIHGCIPSYTDAFFETMSGFTTTGASILNNIEEMPKGLLFWRSATQWMGGMGMIVLSLAILPILGIGGMQLFTAEVPGVTKDKIHPRVRETAKRLWGIYLLFTLSETLLLMIGGMTFYDAINHSFTTMATGGYSTKQASIAYYTSPFIQYVIIVFMIFAGMNFSLHYHILKGNFNAAKKDEEFKAYIGFILVTTLVLTVAISVTNIFGIERSFRDSLFQITSIVTTTGYVTADYEAWGLVAKVFFFILLFVGGSAGSTGGGIKFVRHTLLLKNSWVELKRLIHPRAVIPLRYNGHAVTPNVIANIMAFFLFYIGIAGIGTLVMSLTGMELESSLGAVATSLGNVGPAIASVGPASNFAHVSDFGKWFLSFLMLLGRLELFTILILLSPSFWKK